MSIRASEYARLTLEADTHLRTTARLVLMLLAERCNGRTSSTYSGRWLCTATRKHHSTVTRSIAELVEAGYVTTEQRAGRALVVAFPLDAYISTTSASVHRSEAATGAYTRETGAYTRGTPRTSAHVPGNTGLYTPPPAHPRDCVCDGTGWEHVDDGERGYVRPCNARKEAL